MSTYVVPFTAKPKITNGDMGSNEFVCVWACAYACVCLKSFMTNLLNDFWMHFEMNSLMLKCQSY